MRITRYFVSCIALAAVMAANLSARAADEQALIAVLQSADSSKPDKAITCKKLAVFGSKDAVPALAPLLNDDELISWARIALESIPGPEADEALRNAMGTLEGRSLIGVINSIAVRRDAGAVPGLTERLKDKDAEVASAAAVALGKIGGEPAIKTLRQSLAGMPMAVRSAVAEGCILAAERLLANGKSTDAAAIYDEVRQADVPKQRIVEATRGVILARGSEGIPLLVEQLRSDDRKMFQIGLMTARELPGKAVTDVVAAEMAKATPQRSASLLYVLANRGDATASPAMVQAARSGPTPVRIAAIGVLQNSGSASCVPTLLAIALEDDAEIAGAAKTALAEFPNKEVDASIAAQLPRAEGKMLVTLMEIVGQRRIAATPALIEALDAADATVRQTALAALGETIELKDLDVLISTVTSPKKAEDTATAVKALRAACIRMPDGAACTGKLVDAMLRSPIATKCTLLDILGAMGGPEALAVIAAAGKDVSPELQDTATRLLGEWMNVDAGPVLLDVAQNAPVEKYRIRAIRGYIRLVRQFNMPAAQRAQMCALALKAAERTTEKKLVLQEVIGLDKYASAEMLQLALEAKKDPALKDDATRISAAIAKKLGRD
ncbi:MAG: HEAT repeat domain-containing protein [Planctomycetes bacterium]|nr:HEAT repeat domain-containing protein [Planctomycetota bacterium]MBL7041388.1 HEAT repeat domain-containing protein [Pirellulaceae bacterium]